MNGKKLKTMSYITVDVDLDEFTDRELVSELRERGYIVTKDRQSSIISEYDLTYMIDEYIKTHSLLELQILIEQEKPAKAGKNQLSLL